MSKVVDSLISVGDGIHQIVVGPQTLYMIYFFAFLFGIYALVNAVFQRVAPKGNGIDGNKLLMFSGKPGKVIAFMISVISTGGIFYGGKMGQARSMEELLYLFNGFGGLLIILFLAGGIAGVGIYYYLKLKNQEDKNLPLIILLGAIYIASSLLLPFFVTSANLADATINSKGSVGVGYIGYFTGDTFSFVYDFLDYTSMFSGFFLFVFVILYLASLFKGENKILSDSQDGEKSKDNIKRIKDCKRYLNEIMSDLRISNNHFNNKLKLLDQMKSELDSLKRMRGN